MQTAEGEFKREICFKKNKKVGTRWQAKSVQVRDRDGWEWVKVGGCVGVALPEERL